MTWNGEIIFWPHCHERASYPRPPVLPVFHPSHQVQRFTFVHFAYMNMSPKVYSLRRQHAPTITQPSENHEPIPQPSSDVSDHPS
jgi:hypothetical protein